MRAIDWFCDVWLCMATQIKALETRKYNQLVFINVFSKESESKQVMDGISI